MQLRPPVEHTIRKTLGYWVETDTKRFLDLQLGYSAYTWGYNNRDLLAIYANIDVMYECLFMLNFF